jgi:hypothetical protein
MRGASCHGQFDELAIDIVTNDADVDMLTS